MATIQQNLKFLQLNLPVGSIIRVVGSYTIASVSGMKTKTHQLRTEWMIQEWNTTINGEQFVTSIKRHLLYKVFCCVQSNQVRWTSLTVTYPTSFGNDYASFRIPIAGLTGQLKEPAEFIMGIELTSIQVPKSKYTLQLYGVPSTLDIHDRSTGNKMAQKLNLLEKSLVTPLRIPVFPETGFSKSIIDLSYVDPVEKDYSTFTNSDYQELLERKKTLETEIKAAKDTPNTEGNLSTPKGKTPGNETKKIEGQGGIPGEKTVYNPEAVLYESSPLEEIVLIFKYIKIITRTIKRVTKKRRSPEAAPEIVETRRKQKEQIQLTAASITTVRRTNHFF